MSVMQINTLHQQARNTFDRWQAPTDWLTISTLDMHTGGEPLRIITSGFGPLIGETILEKRQYCLEHYDQLRKAIILEPRGHSDMYAALITEPERKNSHFGVLFLHNEGYSTMCGHAIIALSKAAVQCGIITTIDGANELRIDTPAGLIIATIVMSKGLVTDISFVNIASFVTHHQQKITVDGIGEVIFDIAYGGAFYAYIDSDKIGLDLSVSNSAAIINTGKIIKQAISGEFVIQHPDSADLSFLYGVIFVSHKQIIDKKSHSRNVCVFADGELDRSPTGTGVSGRVAIAHANGELAIDQAITIESILGSSFTVKVIDTTKVADYDAVLPQISGMAYVVAKNEFYIDPSDPLRHGFLLR